MLENYDPVGKWRQVWPATQKPIDASGVLFDGTRIQGAAAFKRWLVANVDYFGNCLSEKLLTYATGRVLNYSEKQEVKQLVTQSRLDGDGFKGLVLDLISSRTFMNNLYSEPKGSDVLKRSAGFQPVSGSTDTNVQSPADASVKQPFKGHEPFDKVDPSRFLRFSPKNTTIRNGAIWTRGESGGKYSPFVGIPIDEIDCSISFRYRHLGDGKMLWLFIDGDDGFGGQDHMLRVQLLRNAVRIQVDGHTKNPKDPKLLKTLDLRRKQSPEKEDRPPDTVSGAYRVGEKLKPDAVDLQVKNWHNLELVFQGDSLVIRLDNNRWTKTLQRPGFAFRKNMLLFMLNGGESGIEIDDLKIMADGISMDSEPLSATAVAGPLSEGTWTRKAYKVAGKWSIEEEGVQLVLKLGKKFKTKSGPDLKIFLTPQTVDSVNGSNATEGALLIAPLKSYESRAAATYPIPAGTDLSKYKAIVIHCEKLSKLWGVSAL